MIALGNPKAQYGALGIMTASRRQESEAPNVPVTVDSSIRISCVMRRKSQTDEVDDRHAKDDSGYDDVADGPEYKRGQDTEKCVQ